MSAIILITGNSRGDALGSIMRAVGNIYRKFGFEIIEANLNEYHVFSKIEKAVNEKDILFAFTTIGIGRDVMLPDASGNQRNLWEVLGIPFISNNGDSPGYYFDRHVNPAENFAILYTFREHYALRKKLGHHKGLTGITLPCLFDMQPPEKIDFNAKQNGKLVFLKNGGDPEALRQIWKAKLRPYIQTMLMELSDLLASNITINPHVDIDALVCEMFKTKGIDIDEQLNLRLFFTAQLDDYLRRFKGTFMAEVLRDFPVEIHGQNWNHVDFSGSTCTYVDDCDYHKSVNLINNALGVIDMSPNTEGGFHDRPLRALGAYTLFLTNEQECMASTFADHAKMTFRFDRDSIAERVNTVISNPVEHLELAVEASRSFNEQFTHEQYVRSMVELADVVRLGASTKSMKIADYFVWPPAATTGPVV